MVCLKKKVDDKCILKYGAERPIFSQQTICMQCQNLYSGKKQQQQKKPIVCWNSYILRCFQHLSANLLQQSWRDHIFTLATMTRSHHCRDHQEPDVIPVCEKVSKLPSTACAAGNVVVLGHSDIWKTFLYSLAMFTVGPGTRNGGPTEINQIDECHS